MVLGVYNARRYLQLSFLVAMAMVLIVVLLHVCRLLGYTYLSKAYYPQLNVIAHGEVILNNLHVLTRLKDFRKGDS